jgi:hypothetical protein
MTTGSRIDLPDGQISEFGVQPPLQIYSALLVGQIISTNSRHPVPQEGRWPSSQTLGRDAVDATASGAQGRSQGEMNLVSDWPARRTNDVLAYGKTVWS